MRHNKRYLAILFITLAAFVLITQVFKVRSITVVGGLLANEGDIRRIIGQPNLLWADLKGLEKKIARQTFVKQATINVIGISGIKVTIEEYRPFLNVDISGVNLQVSSDGTILSIGDINKLPVIYGLLPFPFMPGQAIPKEYLYFIHLAESLADLGLERIDCQDDKVTLTMIDEVEVYLGKNLEEPDIVRQKLKEITMRGQKHKYIDLSQKGYARGL